jgi:hypothetical protein
VTQYSLFGAAAAVPVLEDLDGLLLAGGQWARSGRSARLSIVVSDRWRARALHAAFTEREIGELHDPVVEAAAGVAVRTAFTDRLLGVAARWTKGARQRVPTDLVLGAGGLRLWAIATGQHAGSGYLLPCASSAERDQVLHRVAGAQLAQLGVAALSLSRVGVGTGPAWRVTSARRLRRLAELLGPPPSGCGADWPGAPDAPDTPEAPGAAAIPAR